MLNQNIRTISMIKILRSEIIPMKKLIIITLSIMLLLSGCTAAAPDATAKNDTAVTTSEAVSSALPEMPVASQSPGPSMSQSVEASPGPSTEVSSSPVETEKTPEEMIAENAFDFLISQSPHTDEEINSELIISPYGKYTEIGSFNVGDVQGRLLGYYDLGDNLLLFMGFKDMNRKRFVTAMRIPLYLIEDSSLPCAFCFVKLDQPSIKGGGKDSIHKNEADIFKILDQLINENLVSSIEGKQSLKFDTDASKKYSDNENAKRFINEHKKNIDYQMTLGSSVCRNHNNPDYKNPNLKLWEIRGGSSKDQITSSISTLISGDVVNIPMASFIRYYYTNAG